MKCCNYLNKNVLAMHTKCISFVITCICPETLVPPYDCMCIMKFIYRMDVRCSPFHDYKNLLLDSRDDQRALEALITSLEEGKQCQDIVRTLSEYYQDIVRTMSRHFQSIVRTLPEQCQDIIKILSEHFQDIVEIYLFQNVPFPYLFIWIYTYNLD